MDAINSLLGAAIPKSLLTAAGDTIYASGAGTPVRLPIGTSGQVWTVVGGVPVWAAPPAATNPMTTAGDIIIAGASGVQNRLGIGSSGQSLVVASGLPAWKTRAAVTVAPSNPTAVTSTSQLMLGLNAQITPAVTGTVAFWITGRIPTPAFDSYTWNMKFGTGTPPTNGAAVTGTSIGHTVSFNTNINYDAVFLGHTTGLTLGTAYWWDIAVSSVGPNSISLQDVTLMAVEI